MTAAAALTLLSATAAFAQPTSRGGEANLKLPDLSSVTFLGNIDGHKLLLIGIIFCVLGLVFGLAIFTRLRNLPVHRSMREISELIYETCKTYLVTQGKFLLILWAVHRGRHRSLLRSAVTGAWQTDWRHPAHHSAVQPGRDRGQLSAWRGSASASTPLPTRARRSPACAGKPYPIYQIPLQAGMSIGMMLISVELLIMLFILLFIPGDYAGPCFIGFAIGESLGAAALRIAGGIFTKIADIGSDLMKIVFKIKEDDARNPGVIADCTGDNAGDSVGPTADGFETYGVTGVALITFILLGVQEPDGAGAVAGVDLRDAHHDAGLQRGCVLPQRRHCQGQVRQRRQDEFRSAADLAGLDHFDRFHRAYLRRLLRDYSRHSAATPRSGGSWRPSFPAARWPAR